MQVTAKLKHLRMSPRKVRIVADLMRGLSVKQARAQLQFATKKASEPLLKLLNSAVSNARHSYQLEENNLYISKLTVDGGASLKRWMPRAMGRATPILKRTSHVNLILEERTPGKIVPKIKKREAKEKEVIETKPLIEKEERIFAAVEPEDLKAKPIAPGRPYGASGQAKKRFFSRQTFGNIRKIFRRKSI